MESWAEQQVRVLMVMDLESVSPQYFHPQAFLYFLHTDLLESNHIIC